MSDRPFWASDEYTGGRPIRVEGGSLTAHDHRSDDERLFAVHRITTVTPLSPPHP